MIMSFFDADFFKIGGFCIILPCLNSKYTEVRSETALLVGELAQNNEFCQKHLLELNVLPKLIELLSDLSDEAEVSSHAFHAVSCVVRSYEPGMNAFVEMGGLECLLSLIQEKDREKLIIKSMFLINSFAQDSPKVRNDLIQLNAIERIVETIIPKGEYDTRLEQTLAALTSLVEGDDAIQRCRNENLKLRAKLNEIVAMGSGKDECQVSEHCSVPIVTCTPPSKFTHLDQRPEVERDGFSSRIEQETINFHVQSARLVQFTYRKHAGSDATSC